MEWIGPAGSVGLLGLLGLLGTVEEAHCSVVAGTSEEQAASKTDIMHRSRQILLNLNLFFSIVSTSFQNLQETLNKDTNLLFAILYNKLKFEVNIILIQYVFILHKIYGDNYGHSI
jgi:hypothetical protein